ncbi:GNAT family N-acetyltransferase [Gordonia crocea]|uniref:N-acetyltransferase n=1 Tax=Gordonia crocea TaxID=589162 RepID=A0A7I9UY43_9ACTN|nr:GNAT family N-acetyltransferase [Gordonia crocea]GED97852.1 N-acetyltransferase [Gordonia crocea]
MPLVETVTDPGLADEVSAVAAATFPLACPPHAHPDAIAEFIKANLSTAAFAGHITAADSDVLVVRSGPGGPVVGYSLLHHRPPTDPEVAAVVVEPSSEISKIYVRPDHHAHRTGAAHSPAQALMAAAVARARERGSAVVWLGVNQQNERAQRFYEKSGFTRAGTKTFNLGGNIEHDYVLVKPAGTD